MTGNILNMTDKAQELEKVSVIIPTYNREHFIAKAIYSVIEQGYGNIEIIVVDDHSTDDTEIVVKRLLKDFTCIKYFKNIRRKGPSGARNTGIFKSSGQYIAFLDSDDIWLPNHLISGIEILARYPQLDFLFGNFELVDYKSQQHLYNFFDQKVALHSLQCVNTEHGLSVVNDNIFIALIKEIFLQFGTVICRRHVFDDISFNEDIVYGEDRDIGIRLFKESHARFAYRNDITVRIYRHDECLTRLGDSNIGLERSKCDLLLFTSYLRKYNLSRLEKSIVFKSIHDVLLEMSYYHRKSGCHFEAFLDVFRSFRFGISYRQAKEMAKTLAERVYSLCKGKKRVSDFPIGKDHRRPI